MPYLLGTSIDRNLHAIITIRFWQLGNILPAITGIIDNIQVMIGYIDSFSPIGFNSDFCHSVWYIEVCSLREYTSTRSKNIFSCTFAVSKVIAIPFIACFISTSRTTYHTGNLPTSYNFVIRIVSCAYIIKIRQLNLVIVKVEAVEVLISTLQGKLRSGNAGTTQMHGQCLAQFATLIASY